MTTEQKTFISFADLLALEFRCKTCGASVSRPLKNWRQPPSGCGNCPTQWLADGDDRHLFLDAVVETLRKLAAFDKDAKYTLRAEIKPEDQIGENRGS